MKQEVQSLAHICAQCKQFDFVSLFNRDAPPSWDGTPTEPAFESCKEMELVPCDLCRLIAAVRCRNEHPLWDEKHTFHLRAHSSLRMYALKTTKTRLPSRPSIALIVCGGRVRVPGDRESTYGMIARIASPADILSLSPYELYGSSVHPKSVNFDAVKWWFSVCVEQHKLCRTAPRGSPCHDFRVINCDTLELIWWNKVPSGQDYFTLSYVWGKAPPETTALRSDMYCTSLSLDRLPRVIKDSIKVITRLRPRGSRYLWVDRYCINQKNAAEKHNQIRAMDVIYEGAFATIIAASGDGSEAGLPGMGFASRLIQPSAKLKGIEVVSTLPELALVLRKTVWARRGWTYQEAMLSKRCLIFTDVQVYFACRESTECEAIIKHPSLKATGDRLPTALAETRSLLEHKQLLKSDYQVLSDHTTEYSKRELSYDSDSLNALKGLLARSPFRTYWGIPILSTEAGSRQKAASPNYCLDVCAGFAAGMISWRQGQIHAKRKKTCPSWSWAGWSSTKYFQPHDIESFSVLYPIEIWIETLDGERVNMQDVCSSTAGNLLSELSHFLHLQVFTIKIRLQPIHKHNPAYHVNSGQPESTEWPSNAFRGVLCYLHPDTACNQNPWHGPQNSENSKIIMMVLDAERPHDIFERFWDALLLPSAVHIAPTVGLLFVEHRGDAAYRIGVHDVPPMVVERLPKVQRTIRLG